MILGMAIGLIGYVSALKSPQGNDEFRKQLEKSFKDVFQNHKINVHINPQKSDSKKSILVELKESNDANTAIKGFLDILYIRLCIMLVTICDRLAADFRMDVIQFDSCIKDLFQREETIIKELQLSEAGLKIIQILKYVDFCSNIKSPRFNDNVFAVILRLRETATQEVKDMYSEYGQLYDTIKDEKLSAFSKENFEEIKKYNFFSINCISEILYPLLEKFNPCNLKTLKKNGFSTQFIEFFKNKNKDGKSKDICMHFKRLEPLKDTLEKNNISFDKMCKDFDKISADYIQMHADIIASLLNAGCNFSLFKQQILSLKMLMSLFTLKSIKTSESKDDLKNLSDSLKRLAHFTSCSKKQKTDTLDNKKNSIEINSFCFYTKVKITSYKQICLSKKEYEEIANLCKKYPEIYSFLFDLQPWACSAYGQKFISSFQFDDGEIRSLKPYITPFIAKIISIINERCNELSPKKQLCNAKKDTSCKSTSVIVKDEENVKNQILEKFENEKKKSKEQHKLLAKSKIEQKKKKEENIEKAYNFKPEPIETITTNTNMNMNIDVVSEQERTLNQKCEELTNTFLVHGYLTKEFNDSLLIELSWGPEFYHIASCLVKKGQHKKTYTVPTIDFNDLYERYSNEKTNFEHDSFHHTAIALFRYHLRQAIKYDINAIKNESWFINFCNLEKLNINQLNNKSVFVIDGYLFTNSYFYNQLKKQYSNDSKVLNIAHDWIRKPGVFKGLFVLIVDNNKATHACFHCEKEESIFHIIKK
jgi:hypothetical protein